MSLERLTKLLHENGKTVYKKDFKPVDPSEWPEEWKTTHYKEYLRFPSIALPDVEEDTELVKRIVARRSSRKFSNEGLTLHELTLLLRYTCGQFTYTSKGNQKIHRAYPSAGARYPTEMYIILRTSKDKNILPGVYHYNVRKNTLEFMWEEKGSRANPSILVRDTWAERASALFVMTSVFSRSQNKYGDRGYRYACIEIGAIVQNFYLLADKLGLPCVAYGGTNDDEIEKLLALDVTTESVVTAVLVG